MSPLDGIRIERRVHTAPQYRFSDVRLPYSRDAGSDGLVQAEEGRHSGPQDYNMEFLKKRDKDLNITLIIVSLAVGASPRESLIRCAGWSPLCRDFRLHHLH